VKPDLTILTVDSLAGNDAVQQAEEFHKCVGIDATILTKVDADVKGGAALSVTYVTQKPILFIGVGQAYKDLEVFDPQKFVNMMLR
jgi:fused signal recognition particle receptor